MHQLFTLHSVYWTRKCNKGGNDGGSRVMGPTVNEERMQGQQAKWSEGNGHSDDVYRGRRGHHYAPC